MNVADVDGDSMEPLLADGAADVALSPPKARFGIPVPVPLKMDRFLITSTWYIAMAVLALCLYQLTFGSRIHLDLPLRDLRELDVSVRNCDIEVQDFTASYRYSEPFARVSFSRYFVRHWPALELDGTAASIKITYSKRISYGPLSR